MNIKRNTCLLFNCKEKTIQAHSISKKISLESISEKQKLIEVQIKQVSEYRKKPFFKNVGINKATTSLCFCKKHDEIFNKIDKYGIKTFEDSIYQFYRSMSVLYNEEKNSLLNMLNLNITKKELSSYIINKIKSNSSLSDIEISEANIEKILSMVKTKKNSRMIEKFIKEKLIFKELVTYIEVLLEIHEFQNIEKNKLYVEEGIKKTDYFLFFYIADFQIPVAVNTFNKFSINGKLFNYYNIVVPLKAETVIICLLPKDILKDTNIVKSINESFLNKLGVLNFVEIGRAHV